MRRVLVISSRFNSTSDIDGGSMTTKSVIEALKNRALIDIMLPDSLSVTADGFIENTIKYDLPLFDDINDKFKYRDNTSMIIAAKLKEIIHRYDCVVVIHVFHALDFVRTLDKKDLKKIVIFPMFLSTCYVKSGEAVPIWYIEKEKEILSKVRTIITPSLYEAEQLSVNYGIIDSNIVCIPRKISKFFQPEIRDKVSSPVKFICVASHRKQKRTYLAPKFMNCLRLYGIQAFLTMVGGIQNDSEFNLYKDSCINYNVLDKIETVYSLSQEEMGALFNSSDFLVSFSSCETYGRAIQEALYSGLPSIVLDERGELLKLLGNRKGIIFCRSIEDMGQVVCHLFNKSAEYNTLSYESIIDSMPLGFPTLDVELSNAILS